MINYTAQAAGRPYTTFTNTLSAYRIVFFLTTFNTQMYGPNTQLIPNLWFTITAQVLNSSSYSISLSTTGPMMM